MFIQIIQKKLSSNRENVMLIYIIEAFRIMYVYTHAYD